MADKPDRPTPIPEKVADVKLSEGASSHAPFLYFEDATAYGHLNGVIRITLEAMQLIADPSTRRVTFERVITGHLRMNIPAAQSLKAALDGALLLATPPESDAKN